MTLSIIGQKKHIIQRKNIDYQRKKYFFNFVDLHKSDNRYLSDIENGQLVLSVFVIIQKNAP
jgi:hypothetical protein